MTEITEKTADVTPPIPTPEPTLAQAIEPEVVLSSLLREYKKNTEARAEQISVTRMQIENLTAHMNFLAAPFDAALQELYGKIETLTFARKEKFVCESGKVTYFKGGVKRSWDLDALDNTCNFDPFVKQMIWMHRQESPFDPRITIKVG